MERERKTDSIDNPLTCALVTLAGTSVKEERQGISQRGSPTQIGNIIESIWQLPQFIIIQCMPCPVNHRDNQRGWTVAHTLARLTTCHRVRGKGKGLWQVHDIFTSDLWIILYIYSLVPLCFCVFPNQISLGPARHMKGSIEPQGVLSNGIDNAIAQISFPLAQDVTIKHLRTNQT